MPEKPKSLVKDSPDKAPVERPSPEDEIAAIPEEARHFYSMMLRFSSRGIGHPLFDKFEPAHIDKWLDYSQRDDDHEFELAKRGHWFQLAYVVLAVAVLSALVVYLLPDNQPLLMDLLRALVVFGGGFGAGYGFRKTRERK